MTTNSYADVIRDWEGLLTAVRDHPEEVVDVERYRLALDTHLTETKVVKDRQATAAGIKQKATQNLREMTTQGKEMAIRLRGAVRASLGPKSELLTQFKIAPIRSRPKRRTPEKPAPTPTPSPTPLAQQPPGEANLKTE